MMKRMTFEENSGKTAKAGRRGAKARKKTFKPEELSQMGKIGTDIRWGGPEKELAYLRQLLEAQLSQADLWWKSTRSRIHLTQKIEQAEQAWHEIRFVSEEAVKFWRKTKRNALVREGRARRKRLQK